MKTMSLIKVGHISYEAMKVLIKDDLYLNLVMTKISVVLFILSV